VELSPVVIATARQLLDRHPLRAYDAVQLASALISNQALASAGLAPPVFLSSDDRLLNVANAEGLNTDNPNLHS
jgi:predicted nucleic acid-binding protein